MHSLKVTLPILIIFQLFCTSSSFGQDDIVLNTPSERKGAFNESIKPLDTQEETIPYYYKRHRQLPTYFSGVAIELTTSDLPLRRDYFIFERFGNVKVCPLEDGGFSYVITGFRNERTAKSFLKNIVIHQASEARVVVFSKGKRKGKL